MVEPIPQFAMERYVCDRTKSEKGIHNLKIIKNLKCEPYIVETAEQSFSLDNALFASKVFLVEASMITNIDDIREKIGLKSVDPESTAQIIVT
jgi:hypothetical protein